MKAQIESINPQKAKQMLLGSECFQRNVSQSQVHHLSKQMTDGRWRLNGETIVISENNQVLDGQHRLLAIIESGVTIDMLVVYGARHDCFHTIDTGKSRTPGNTMHIAGVKNAINVAGLLSFRWKYYKAKSRNGSLNMWERPTHYELVSFAEGNQMLTSKAVSVAAKVRKSVRGINPSTIGGSYIIFVENYDEITVDSFFESLCSGENLAPNSPVLTFRNKMISGGSGPTDLKWQVKAAYLFMAFKKYAEKKPSTLLRWTEGKDAFPFI